MLISDSRTISIDKWYLSMASGALEHPIQWRTAMTR